MFKEELCILCGDCLVSCPFNEYTREEAVAERQILMEGNWAPILHNCASCHACNEICPQGANPWDLVSKLQGVYGELNNANILVEQAQKVDEERPKVLASPPPEPAEVVLATCTIGEVTPQVFDSLLYVDLPKLGGPAYNCLLLEFFGDEEGQRARVQGFVDAIARYQPREVVCYHQGCYYILTCRAPEYDIKLPFRPVQLFEHLLRTVRRHQDKIRPLNMRIAFQRPCTSHNTPWQEPFLDELLDLIGCARVLRHYDREDALCCGRILSLRGLVDRARETALRNIEDSLEYSSDALVYLCPSCGKSYEDLCRERGLPIYHISELCQMALGEK